MLSAGNALMKDLTEIIPVLHFSVWLRWVIKLSVITGNMRYLLGTLGYDSTTHEGTYYNFSSGRMKDRSFCFSLGFNYYMQGKNFKYRNKKSLQSTEQGIKL